MARSTTHYADSETNNILKRLHNKLRPAGTPVMRVEYIIELLLLRIFEVKLKQDETFAPLRKLFVSAEMRIAARKYQKSHDKDHQARVFLALRRWDGNPRALPGLGAAQIRRLRSHGAGALRIRLHCLRLRPFHDHGSA